MRKGDLRIKDICGDETKVRYLGKGTFWKAWTDKIHSTTVYLEQKLTGGHDDQSKEAIWLFADTNNPHIPTYERLCADYNGITWFKCPRYYPLIKEANPEAYEHRRILVKAWEKASLECRKIPCSLPHNVRSQRPDGLDLNRLVYANIQGDNRLPLKLRLAIQSIAVAAENYNDEYMMEFKRTSVKVDYRGRLVLVDVLFNWKAMMQRQLR